MFFVLDRKCSFRSRWFPVLLHLSDETPAEQEGRVFSRAKNCNKLELRFSSPTLGDLPACKKSLPHSSCSNQADNLH